MRVLRAAACLSLCLAAAPVAAQDAGAKALFNRGLAAMKAGDYATGCPQIAESFRLDPQPGALFTWAECEARAGAVATAWSLFDRFIREQARLAKADQVAQGARLSAAEARRAELEPRIPHLILTLPRGLKLSGELALSLDGKQLTEASLGVRLPVDPGLRQLRVARRGELLPLTVELKEGEERRLELPVPEEPAEAALAPPAVVAPSPARSAEPSPRSKPPRRAEPSADAGQRSSTAGWASLGVGAAGFIAAGVATFVLLSKRTTLTQHCEADVCDSRGAEAGASVPMWNIIGSVGFGVGVGGVALGSYLLLSAPPAPAGGTAVRLRGVGGAPRLSFGGNW